MALSPALTVTNLQPLFTVPIAVGTTFTAGDVVTIGTATTDSSAAQTAFGGVAMYDYNCLGSTANTNAICVMGRATFPKAAATSCTAGTRLVWGTTSTTMIKPGSTQTVSLSGYCVTTATTSSATVDVIFFPNTI
jgi:predicted RecA/RadA family phage recombinase